MYIKMLDGPFAGEVKDLRSDVALDHLRTGRAAPAFSYDVMVEVPDARETESVPQVLVPKAVKPEKRKR